MKFNNAQDWMREVIWYGHRSGKYLCNIKELNETSEDQEKFSNTKDSAKFKGDSFPM